MTLDVLVIDDEFDIREIISDILKDEGFVTRTASGSKEAFEEINTKVPNAIILDIWLQGSELDGLGILEIIKQQYPLIPVLIISGHGTIDTAVTAIKMGAFYYIKKPFNHEDLLITLKRACESTKLRRENLYLKSKVIDKTELIGTTPAIIKLKSEINKIAPTVGRIMIHGSIGSGKELCAKLIHKHSKRRENPFVIFNPTFMSHKQIIKKLFNETDDLLYHEPEVTSLSSSKQTITKTKKTVIESANHGTLYIDEISDLPLASQNRLLQFLKDQVINVKGQKIVTDVRIISSTTKDLEELIKQGKFSRDLYYRLNVIPLKVPSLVERKEDIPALIEYFTKQLRQFAGLKPRSFSKDAIVSLQSYNWPGNIRHLRNIIEWVLIMHPPSNEDLSPITTEMLPQEILNNNNMNILSTGFIGNIDIMSMPLRTAREFFEKQYLGSQMERFGNNISKTSTFIGMERSALHRKLKNLNLHMSNNKAINKQLVKVTS